MEYGSYMAKGSKIEKALYNIDKWMPEDFELQNEYYQLINAKDQKGMEQFLDMYADQDRLMRYGIKYEDLGELSKAIINGSNYADGGMMADGGRIVSKEKFDKNDENLSEDIYEWSLEYWPQEMEDDIDFTYDLQGSLKENNYEKVIELINQILSGYRISEESKGSSLILKMEKNKKFIKNKANKFDNMTPYEKANKIAEEAFGEFGIGTLEYDDYPKILNMGKANKLAKEYGESNFRNLDESDMETILNENPDILKDYKYADGGMLNDEMQIKKLAKQFKGKDLYDDEIVDEYTVKQFDSREDDDVIERWKMSKKKKFYVVPFDAQDDSFYYILVPKMKMEDGGYMAKGGKTKTNPAKFRDKVNAITKKLAGTKVPKKYKKDYGTTYDKKEANTAAKRIAGAKLAEVRAKLAKKKK